MIFFVILLQPLFKVELSSFSPSQPLFFFLKLALILLLLAWAWHGEQRWGSRPAPVTTIGQESLLVYAAHIVVIYGAFWPSLSFLIGKTRSWLEVAVMALVLIAAMFVLALAWHQFKTTRPAAAKRVFWLGAFVLAVIMIWRT